MALEELKLERKVVERWSREGEESSIEKDRRIQKKIFRDGEDYFNSTRKYAKEHYWDRVHPHIPLQIQEKALENEKELFEAFCDYGDVGGLYFYSELITPEVLPLIIDLEKRIIQAIKSIPSKEKLKKAKLKRKIQLGWKEGNYVIADKPNLKITSINEVSSNIIAVDGAGGAFHTLYGPEDISFGAPIGANAYFTGITRKLIVRDKDSKEPEGIPKMKGMSAMWSLIIGDTRLYSPDVPEEEYQITPVRYFEIETEKPLDAMKRELGERREKYFQDKNRIKNTFKYLEKLLK